MRAVERAVAQQHHACKHEHARRGSESTAAIIVSAVSSRTIAQPDACLVRRLRGGVEGQIHEEDDHSPAEQQRVRAPGRITVYQCCHFACQKNDVVPSSKKFEFGLPYSYSCSCER